MSELVSKIFRKVFYPLCRLYARCVVKDRPADPTLRRLSSLAFWAVFGFWPDLLEPRRFTERLWNRMLYCRDPILTLISDKHLVRDYVAKRTEPGILIPLLWTGHDPRDIPYDLLPGRFVIKTNHGCGFNILVPDKGRAADIRRIEAQLKRWLGVNWAQDMHLGILWGYKNITPLIMIEEFIEEDGKPPVDYKFYCFSGRAEFATIHFDRFGDKKSISVDRECRQLRFKSGFKHHEFDFHKPKEFEAMLKTAEALSEGFNFLRVDLYCIRNRIYFGELTPYPVGVSVFKSFNIEELDDKLGSLWGTNPRWV